MIQSMLSTCKWQCPKAINTATKLKTCSDSICELEILKFCFARKPTFRNWLSCICHRVSGSAHANEEINNLLNKDNSPMTIVKKDSSRACAQMGGPICHRTKIPIYTKF